jgi:putative endonuclease
MGRLAARCKQMRRTVSLGDRGERAAIRFLKRQRYIIIAQSQRNQLGEIDIIAVDRSNQQRTIVFIEVKTRTSTDKGHPADAVDEAKQMQISRLATAYCRQHALDKYPCRFDIVAITWESESRSPQIEHYRAAFDAITGPYE